MSFFSHDSVSFKRISDGNIRPVCNEDIKKGTVVFYELPVKSTGEFQIDIIRYTMRCVYSGQLLFPCTFNNNTPSNEFKVFFDYAFKTKFRRNTSEKLAVSLLKHNTPPYIFKSVGVFGLDAIFNCQRISLPMGDTFLVTTTDLIKGDVLTSSRPILVPSICSSESQILELIHTIDASRMCEFNFGMEHREIAQKYRPVGKIECVSKSIDQELESRLEKYRLDSYMGMADFKEKYKDLMEGDGKHKDDMDLLEETFNDLCKENSYDI